MADNPQFQVYKGDGSTIQERNISLPSYEKLTRMDAPKGYVAAPPLRDAVNVAIALGQPLLLTGEPGTGKTRLAYSIAYELNMGDPLVFHTKTTSSARDLFYRYDSLGHFHDAQLKDKNEINIKDYITYEAMGKAIIKSKESRSIVLIDEIDKAPRDLPNDILNELENMEFTVKETGEKFEANKPNRPILILTSNSEKNLPDAFLRRVVYYHIPFPDKETLEQIIRNRLNLSDTFRDRMLSDAISHFIDIRKTKGLRKPPATAELLSWIHILDRHNIDINTDVEGEIKKLAMSYSILAKNKEDLEKLKRD
ncbi:MAG: MoxR family ATPase [Bacteroidetes bacterium]|nr:MoxR family ATPase [Bacteroidota bacterium]MCB0850981.1 MoxR family ATPase [Bacteroidota bacterium]